MEKEKKNSIVLGIWVLAAAILLIITVYLVGSRKNMFASTFTISALFSDIEGLQEGNNVRFRGTDVGTIKNTQVINDSSVKVTMVLKENVKTFIKKNAIAHIATDGLMGNKILLIRNQESPSSTITENDFLKTLPPIDMDRVFRKLNSTNENIADITGELKKTTKMINNNNSLLSVLSDTILGKEVRKIDTTFVNNLSKTMKNIKSGSYKFNEDMEALKHNFLFRRYFKKKEKERMNDKQKAK